MKLGENLAHPRALHAHPRESDDVGAREPIEIERLDVLVDNADAMVSAA